MYMNINSRSMTEDFPHTSQKPYNENAIDTESKTAIELLRIPDGVQLFAVEENFDVNAAPPSFSHSLVVYEFENVKVRSKPVGFIEVGDWMYPLVPHRSPVLHCSNGAYMFPNATVQGSSSHSKNIGIVLSKDLDPGYDRVFRELLKNFATLQEQNHHLQGEPKIDLRKLVTCSEERRTSFAQAVHPTFSTASSKKIATNVERSANWLSGGLSKGAKLTVGLVQAGASKLQSKIKPNEQPTKVQDTIQNSLYVTNEVSKVTVTISGAVVRKLMEATDEITKSVTPHLVKAMQESDLDKRSSKKASVIRVANAGFKGMGTVWHSLEKGGKAIAQAVSIATVDTVQYKYGEDAGQSASNDIGTVSNLGKTALDLDNLAVNHVVKKASKTAGTNVLQEYLNEDKK